MSILTAAFASRRIKFVGLAVLAGAALLVSQAFAGRAAHAEEPPQPGIQRIVVPGQGQVSIHANRDYYNVGDWAYICYTLPTHGFFVITDHQPGLGEKVLKAEYGYGGFHCFWGQVTPPYGYETLRLVFYFPWGGSAQDHDSFYVGLPPF
jgi:hypothetical protein